MELTQLQYFVAVAKSLHMTRTAEQLHVAQPALSQSISRLERELGVVLFRREARRLALTPAGAYLLERLQTPLATLAELPAQLRKIAEADRKNVRLRVMAATSLVTDAIIAYRESHPDVHFLLRNAGDQDFDLSITTTVAPVEDTPQTASFEERIFLVVPSEGRYGSAESIRLSDVAEENFISLAGTRQLRGICDGYCLQVGFAPRVGFESDNPASVKKLIAAHAGVGFWPEFSWGDPSLDGGVKRLAITEPDCRRRIVLAHSQHRAAGEEAERFYLYLKDFIAHRFGM